MISPSLPSLLAKHREDLLLFVRREATGLLRWEPVEDLVQGIHLRALEGGKGFEYRTEREFFAWLFRVARRHIGDRHDYWVARRRDAGKMLRLTAGSTSVGRPTGIEPAATATGPSTFAVRKEQVALAMRALAALPPRDQQLLRWMSEDVPLAEAADRLGISYDAAKHANSRAIDRFRKAFELISRRIDPRGRSPK